MDWQKKAPNKVGYWIRLNAIHKPEIVRVFEDYRNEDKALCVTWGWHRDEGTIRIKDNLNKIDSFWWSKQPLSKLPDRKTINLDKCDCSHESLEFNSYDKCTACGKYIEV